MTIENRITQCRRSALNQKRPGILFCMGKGATCVIGADQPIKPAFSDETGNNFLSPNWQVLSRRDQKELGQFTSNVPHPMPKTAGDVVGLIREDGIAVIYWDGKQFRWPGPKE